MPHTSARTGAVLYAKDPERVAAFYVAVAGLREASREADHVRLESEGCELVVLRVPERIAASIALTDPPARRESTPIKLVFPVPSLEAARALAASHGGALNAPSTQWSFRGAEVCDGVDPEGNVVQLRAPAIDRSAHVRHGFGAVRAYLYGPSDLPEFVVAVFDASELERHVFAPGKFHVELRVEDSVVSIEAGTEALERPKGSVYVYVPDVDATYARALERGATSILAPVDKPYDERQCGFVDGGGNTWWVSTHR